MTRCHELGSLLDTILALVDDVFHLDTCAVLLIDEPTGELRVQRARGYDPGVIEAYRGRLGQGVTGRVAREGKPVFVADVRSDPDYVGGVTGAVSEMAAPMQLDGSVIGVLDAELKARADVSEQDMELFATFANHAAVAVQNAKLHESLSHRSAELERQVKRLQLLSQAAQVLSSTLDLDEVLQKILLLSREALRFEQCAVLLFNGTDGELRVRAAIGYDEKVRELHIPVGEGVTGEVARTGKPVLVSDVSRESRYIPGVAGGRCEMAAPLIARGQLLGVLDAESPVAGAFAEADLELLSTFALQAAIAIGNAETYHELERANLKLHRNVIEMERMNRELLEHTRTISDTNTKLETRVHELLTLQEASRTITSSLDLDDTLQAIVRMTREIIHSSMSAIKLMDEESKELRVRVHQTDEQPEESESGPMSREVLGVPLRIGERTIGSFEVSRGVGHFSDEERRLLETLASQAAIAIENARLFENMQRTYFETIRSLAQALEARDSYTKGHSERVMRYALRTAAAMGVSEEDRRILGHASLLHDIGKIGIADAILNKVLPLTADDRKMIENHPIYGDSIIGPLRFLDTVQGIVRHHHERYDGTGYPERLKGDAIPLGARIIAVADSYDAMTSNRPYRKALDKRLAMDEIRKGSGSQFDPRVVNAFLELLEREGPIPEADLGMSKLFNAK
ncbi:MAG: GAF domain-containing protein [Deltaproteobacteria bacterium]|nr:GAF domain-containing protein [Deltaproteobacteria bacterium]